MCKEKKKGGYELLSEPDSLDDATATLGSGIEVLIVVLSVTFSKLGVLIETG